MGKTLTAQFWLGMCKKHPHAHGENLGAVIVFVENMRNTPTPVGKTFLWVALWLQLEKHPHARGENETQVEGTNINEETPPRWWGKLS